MHLGFEDNEYGTKTSKHKCDTCSDPFTICPAVDKDSHSFDNCLMKTCPSYDVNRDLDVMFMSDNEIEKLDVVSLKMLEARKNGIFRKEEKK